MWILQNIQQNVYCKKLHMDFKSFLHKNKHFFRVREPNTYTHSLRKKDQQRQIYKLVYSNMPTVLELNHDESWSQKLWVSHVGDRDLTTRVIIFCLPRNTLSGSWNQTQRRDVNPGTLMQDISIPRRILATRTCQINLRFNFF